jgi:hypothetical protein
MALRTTNDRPLPSWPRRLAAAFVAWAIAASPLAAASTTFAIIGDYGTNTQDEANVAALVTSWNPDFVLTVGDNIYADPNNDPSHWERHVGDYYGQFIKGRGDNRYPTQTSPTQRFFPSVGNHDVANPIVLPGPPYYTGGANAVRTGYLDYFHFDPSDPAGRLPSGQHRPALSYYEFRRGPAHFFALDSEAAFFDLESADEQAFWLETRARASDAPWKFVYFHHPSYSSGQHGDQEHMQWAFADWGISAVFTGHDHTYERIERDGITYFVNGLGGQVRYDFLDVTLGSIVRYNESTGAMRVTVSDTAARFEFFAAIPNATGGFLVQRIDRVALPVPEPAAYAILASAAAAIPRTRRLRTVYRNSVRIVPLYAPRNSN